VLFASPSFTPTIPNACPNGSALLHCGYDTSFPVGVPLVCAAYAVAADALIIAKDAPSAITATPNLTDQPPHAGAAKAPALNVNVQVLGFAAAVCDGRLRFGGGRGVAVVAERGFGDDPGL
ncbi:MAG: hypothetical protein WAK82_21400, partial [Streptosporangiaceae bacterium]